MLLNAYCIFDTKAAVYGAPFYAPTDGSAVRSLQDLANDPNSMVGRHPRDFVLFRVGTFDDQHANLVGLVPAVHVCDAISVVVQPAELPLRFPSDEAEADRVARLNGRTA